MFFMIYFIQDGRFKLVMPHFYGVDHYAKKIFHHQNILRSLLLQKGPRVLRNLEPLKDEVYRKPWSAFETDLGKSDLKTSDNELSLSSYIDKVAKISQQEPPYKLSVNDVTQGLIVENFADSPCLLNPIVKNTSLNSDNSQSYSNRLEEIVYVPVNNLTSSHTFNVGVEVPSSFNNHARLSSFPFYSNKARISKPLCSNSFDSQHESCSLPKVEETIVVGKMTTKPLKDERCNTQEIVSSKKHKNSDFNKQLLEYPISCYNGNEDCSENFKFPNIQFDFVRVEEEALDLSTWDLNLLEPCPTSNHHLLLSHPKINLDNQNGTNHRFDFPLISKRVEPDILHLQSLVWNPFSVDSVAMNIKDMEESLNFQHTSLLNSDFTKDYTTKKLTEEFRLHSEIEISVQETQSSKTVKRHCSPALLEIPLLKFVPKISAIKKNLDLNNSVTNFINLRKKNFPPCDVGESAAANVVVSERSKETFTEEIECEVDELTFKFIARIIEFSKQEVKALVSIGVFKDTKAFVRVDETSLEFTLKEHIKSDDKVACDSLLKLIPIKKALNMALQLDTEASLDFLRSIPNKDDRFHLCIQDLNQIQFEVVFAGHKTSKIMKLSNIISKDPGMCLILISNARQTKSFLIDTLIKVSGIPVAPTISFPDYTCYLYNSEEITPEFPWEKFETIIEYNETSASTKGLISKSNAKHFILKTVLPPQGEIPNQNLEEFKIIAYSSLDFKVLQCLESEYNFVVFQRQAGDQYSHETLIVDEKTCIVIVRNLDEIKQVRLLSALFIKISLSYSLMNLIFDVSTCHHTELYSILFASIAHFKPDELKIQSFYCLSIEDMCGRIVKIAFDAKSNIGIQWKSTELWLKRTWLTEEESNHEKMLSKIPCINSYVAQIMLTTYSLADLMGLELQECIENMPVIPEHILTEFHRTVHITKVSEQNKTVQFDTELSIKEYTPTQLESPVLSYQRTSLPPLNTSFDMGDALSSTYQTPRGGRGYKYANLIKTPMKPQNVVKPFFSRQEFAGSSKNKRAVEEKHKFSFSFSKHRKVMVDKDNVKNDGQATLVIGKRL